MTFRISRRSLTKTTASAAALGSAVALGARSSVFAAPALIQSTGSQVEITYWTSFGSGVNGDAQTKIINDFQAANPDIVITSSIYPGYADLAAALVTALQTGDEPHVAILSDVWWFRFYLAEAITDLAPLLASEGVDTDDYVQSLYTEYTRNGGQWAVPFARSTPLLYFNRDAVEAAGLDESIFKTWSSFAEAAPTLTGGTTDYAFVTSPDDAWGLQGAVWAFGGRYSDEDFNILINQPEAVAAGDYFRNLIANGYASASVDSGTDFATGLAAASIQSTGGLRSIAEAAKFNIGTAFLPEETQFGCSTGGSGLSIIATAPDEVKAAAIKFLDFSTNTQNAMEWSQNTGYMPVRTSSVESADMQAYLAENPNAQVAIDQLPKTQPQDSARVFIPGGDQMLGAAWSNILVNQTPAQDAFDAVAADLDAEKEAVLEQIAAIEG